MGFPSLTETDFSGFDLQGALQRVELEAIEDLGLASGVTLFVLEVLHGFKMNRGNAFLRYNSTATF